MVLCEPVVHVSELMPSDAGTSKVDMSRFLSVAVLYFPFFGDLCSVVLGYSIRRHLTHFTLPFVIDQRSCSCSD